MLALPGTALAAETSPGVSLVGSIPERGVISARAVGQHLYVSALSGVSIYDVSDPRAPVRVGRLELPNAQNEDVDVGSGIMLVSDDPFGGRGALHVIDVRDPANPRAALELPDVDAGHLRLRLAAAAQARHRPHGEVHPGLPLRVAGGLARRDRRDRPARPGASAAGARFTAREAAGFVGTHDVQVDGSGLAWVAGGNGTAAYDVSNPVRPRLVKRTNRRGSRPPLNDLIHHNSLRLRATWWPSPRRRSASAAAGRARCRRGGSRGAAG